MHTLSIHSIKDFINHSFSFRSGSIFHVDPNQTNAWNGLVKGKKKWIFYPPGVCPPGVTMSVDGADVTEPISTGEWCIQFWRYHLEARKHPDVSKRPMEAIVNAGEVIFVPHNWWHMVINLEYSIAITHNYVSSSNLYDCLKFLSSKEDQISGVRDRPGEAIQAGELYAHFVQVITDSYPELLSFDVLDLDSQQPGEDIETSQQARGCGVSTLTHHNMTLTTKREMDKKQFEMIETKPFSFSFSFS